MCQKNFADLGIIHDEANAHDINELLVNIPYGPVLINGVKNVRKNFQNFITFDGRVLNYR